MGAESFFIKPYAVSVLLEEVQDILTKKILVYGERDKTTESIVRHLAKYDLVTDVLHTRHNFYYNVISHRYRLVVMQYKSKPNMTDRMLSIVRGSSKNKDVPIIVYMSAKISDLDDRGVRKVQALKGRCGNLEMCEFMDKGYSGKEFMRLVGKYDQFF